MKKLTIEDIDEIIQKFKTNTKDISKELDKYVTKRAILGLDIYRYSQYAKLPQILIPHLFKYLYNVTVDNCINQEPSIFKNYTKESLEDCFIDTGDGGFQIFETPFEATIFAIYFQANVVRYNSNYESTKELNDIIGDITLRYTLTYDDIYSYENNHYGSGIINCARILSKDKLNRFLIDENVKEWFIKHINTIENLAFLDLKEEHTHFDFINISSEFESIIFGEEIPKIKNIDLMKIGEVKSKMDTLSIYNLHIQTLMYTTNTGFNKLVITLGNLNSLGLNI